MLCCSRFLVILACVCLSLNNVFGTARNQTMYVLRRNAIKHGEKLLLCIHGLLLSV